MRQPTIRALDLRGGGEKKKKVFTLLNKIRIPTSMRDYMVSPSGNTPSAVCARVHEGVNCVARRGGTL